ncbi:MAG: hypothetical protein JXA60_01805, partial [Candidatus Coatesbacteria bacterium]|nr:hypothetical protein [Candidatus Coatesbacteria bacterium]
MSSTMSSYQLKLSSWLLKYAPKISFKKQGDCFEQKYSLLFKIFFPNIEKFWSNNIIPISERMSNFANPNVGNRDVIRKDVNPLLTIIADLHYSVFLNLVYAYYYIYKHSPSRLEDFYYHIASAIDVTEKFIAWVYLLDCKISNKTFSYSDIADEGNIRNGVLYDNNTTYKEDRIKELFCSYFPIDMNPFKNRTNIEFICSVLNYRHISTHSLHIGKIHIEHGYQLIPKREVVNRYRRFSEIREAANNSTLLNRDFIRMDTQMKNDLKELLRILNLMWEKPLRDFEDYFKTDNAELIKLYNF